MLAQVVVAVAGRVQSSFLLSDYVTFKICFFAYFAVKALNRKGRKVFAKIAKNLGFEVRKLSGN